MSTAILVEIHNSENELPRTRNCGGCPSPFHSNHDALNVGQNDIACLYLDERLVSAHLTRQLEFVVTGHLGGGQLLGGQACIRRGYGQF